MAFTVETLCKGSFKSPHSLEQTMAFLCDYDNSIGKQFEGLEQFKKEGPDTFRWVFETLAYGGQELQIQFVTKFEKVNVNLLKMLPVEAKTKATLSGFWQLTPVREGTQVVFEATLVGELPLPGLMKSMVAPLAQREVRKIFERYIENVSKAI